MASTKKTPSSSTATAKLNSILQQDKAKNDIVLKEFPVFLSKTLMEQLYLIQYPQRPCPVSTENMEILETKIKPNQNKIQLSLGLDIESELYDPENGELLAEAAAGIGLDEDEYMPDVHLKLEKTTMESSSIPKLADMSRYAIGVIRRGVVTLTPLSSIVQMKTVFPYLNKADKARTAMQKEKAGEHTEDEEEAEKVTVKFSRNTASASEKSASASSSKVTAYSSYAARKREEEEPWSELSYIPFDSTEFDKLYSTQPSSPFYVLNKKEYLESVFPKYFETTSLSMIPDAEDDKINQDKGKANKTGENQKISIQLMKSMSLPDQLRMLLSNAKVLQYYQIVDFLRKKCKAEFDETTLVRAIQNVGILVQGCWVVQSNVLYSDEFKSSCNGISGLVMQRGRDIILSQFTEHRFVDRKRMTILTKLPPEEVLEILTQISNLVPKKGWEFILPYDTNFLGRFPDVVDRQLMMWGLKKPTLLNPRARHSSNSSEMSVASAPTTRRRRKSSRKESTSQSSGDEGGGNSPERRGRRRQSDANSRQRRNSTRSETNNNPVGIPSRAET